MWPWRSIYSNDSASGHGGIHNGCDSIGMGVTLRFTMSHVAHCTTIA